MSAARSSVARHPSPMTHRQDLNLDRSNSVRQGSWFLARPRSAGGFNAGAGEWTTRAATCAPTIPRIESLQASMLCRSSDEVGSRSRRRPSARSTPAHSPATPPTIAAGTPTSNTANQAVCGFASRPTSSPTMAPATPSTPAPIAAPLPVNCPALRDVRGTSQAYGHRPPRW